MVNAMSSGRTSGFMEDNTHAQDYISFSLFLCSSLTPQFSHPLNLKACYPFPDASVTTCQMKNACFVHSLGLQPPGYCAPPQPLWMSMQNQLLMVAFVMSVYYAHTCKLSSLSHQDLFHRRSSCRLGTREKTTETYLQENMLFIWKKTSRNSSSLYI